MKTVVIGNHLYVKCKRCGRPRRLDKVSQQGFCVSCLGEILLDLAKQGKADIDSLLREYLEM